MVKYLKTGCAEELFGYFRRGIYDFEHPLNIKDYLCEKELFTEAAFEECVAIYEDVKLDRLSLYPNVKETLMNISHMGLKLAVVTDAHTEGALLRLDRTGILEIIDEVITCDMTKEKKPSEQVFHFAVNKCGILSQNSLFVGDSIRRDIQPAKKAGMTTAYAAYGDRNYHDEKVTADYVLHNIDELVEILKEINGDFL
jgi:putative hydrolase of the HAD superfamily